ncbi:hypothetical protein TRVL_01125 [Trypanosoma vivax]|nr:hypothetical protein TRVL_01125 [Trypanosoma vivax]
MPQSCERLVQCLAPMWTAVWHSATVNALRAAILVWAYCVLLIHRKREVAMWSVPRSTTTQRWWLVFCASTSHCSTPFGLLVQNRGTACETLFITVVGTTMLVVTR